MTYIPFREQGEPGLPTVIVQDELDEVTPVRPHPRILFETAVHLEQAQREAESARIATLDAMRLAKWALGVAIVGLLLASAPYAEAVVTLIQGR